MHGPLYVKFVNYVLTVSFPGHITTGATGPYPCCQKHVGLQRQRGHRGERAMSVLAWNNTPILLLNAHSLVTLLTNLREKLTHLLIHV